MSTTRSPMSSAASAKAIPNPPGVPPVMNQFLVPIGHGSITSRLIDVPSRVNRKCRSACPPGKFPSRCWTTSNVRASVVVAPVNSVVKVYSPAALPSQAPISSHP